MIGGQVKNVLAKIAATTMAGAATVLSTVRVAFAASTGTSQPSEYNEILRLAQEKVHAATQLGACCRQEYHLGNGLPRRIQLQGR